MADVGDPGIDSGIVESHAVDDRFLRDEAEQPRLGVSRLRARRDGADFNVPETEPAERVDRVALLVEAGGQAHAVGKPEPHHFHRLRGGGGLQQAEDAGFFRHAQRGHAEVVGGLGIETEQAGAEQRIKRVDHAHKVG